jgi:hypothetical protein
MTDYSASRQIAHLSIGVDEFNRLFGAIEGAFGKKWLSKGDAPLPTLWQRKDAFAVNQLCLLGDAIHGFNAVYPNWVKNHVQRIKVGDANSRRGSTFELIAANLFRVAPQKISPTKRNNPGYDAILTMPDGATFDISFKSYGTSAHELTFRREAERTKEAFQMFLEQAREGGVLYAIANEWPSAADWETLRKIAPKLTCDKAEQVGIWNVKFGTLPSDYGPYASRPTSYQVFFGAPFHKNESKNLSDKFDNAFSNAEKHAVLSPNKARLVIMRIPEAISLPACDRWAKDYLAGNPNSPIDAIYLYQIAVVDKPDGTSLIGHSIAASETAKFKNWRNSGLSTTPIKMNFFVGAPIPVSHLQVASGPHRSTFSEGYYYQRGDFYTSCRLNPEGTGSGFMNNLASGIFQHSVMVFPDGSEMTVNGIFPPTKDITLFD